MKNKVVVLFIVSAILFCGICLIQSRQNQALKRELATLRQTLEERDRQQQADDALKRELTDQQEAMNREAARLAGEVQSLRVGVSNNPLRSSSGVRSATDASATGEKEDGFGDMLKKMLNDPDMKKMMRQQQMVMMDSMYGPLFKQLGLSPEETEKFKELLIDGQMQGVEGAGALFSGERDLAARTEALKAMGERQKQLDEQLKTLLGEERYAQYKGYQESMGERMALDQFQKQLAGGQNPLSEEQSGQLLALMKEERKNSPSIFGNDPNAAPDPAQMEAMLSEEKMNKHFEQQEELNRSILIPFPTLFTTEPSGP